MRREARWVPYTAAVVWKGCTGEGIGKAAVCLQLLPAPPQHVSGGGVTMKIKDYSGVEHDIFSVCVEADRDGRRNTYFYVMGRKYGDYGSVKTCCIHVFRGVEGMDVMRTPAFVISRFSFSFSFSGSKSRNIFFPLFPRRSHTGAALRISFRKDDGHVRRHPPAHGQRRHL